MKTDSDFVKALLQQGPQLSPEEYAAYRRKLKERLARAESDERLMRRIVFVVCGLVGLLWLVLVWVCFSWDVGEAQPGIPLGILMVAAYYVVPVVAGYAVLLYFLKYRPRLRDAQRQEQHALLLDLQRQLNELREQLSQRKT